MYRLAAKRVVHVGKATKRPLAPSLACNTAQPAALGDSPKHACGFHSSAAVLKRHGGASAHEPKYLWRRRKKSKINAKRGLRKKQHGEPGARAKAERAERVQAGVGSNALALTYDEAAEDEKFAGFMEELLAPIVPAAKPVSAMSSYRDVDADQFWSYARRLAAAPATPPEQLWRTYAKLIRVLSMQRRFKEAKLIVLREMLEAGVQPNANIYCALLMGAQHARDSSAVDDIWRHMKASGVSPTPDVWHTLLLALRAVGRVDDALAAGAAMQKAGHPWDQKVYFCLLDMLVKARRHKEAWDIYETIITTDMEITPAIRTIMMSACAHLGQFERALNLMDELEMAQQLPNVRTFNVLLLAASTSPLWMKAYGDYVDKLRARMQGYGIAPDSSTYQALLCCYGNHGDADGVARISAELQEYAEAQLEQHRYELTQRLTSARSRSWSPVGNSNSSSGSGSSGSELMLTDEDQKQLAELTAGRELRKHTYTSLLVAWGGCMSVGERLGTRPRYGSLPEHIAEREKERATNRTIQISRVDRDKLEDLRYSATLDYDLGLEESVTGKNWRAGKRTKFRGMREVAEGRDEAAYDTYKRTLDAIVAKYDKQQAILAAGGTLADYFDADGEPLEQQLQLNNGSAVTVNGSTATATASSSDGSKRVVLTDSAGNQYRDWGAEGTDVETLIEELRLEQESLKDTVEPLDNTEDDAYGTPSYTAEELAVLAEQARAEARGDYSHLEREHPDRAGDPEWQGMLQRLKRRQEVAGDIDADLADRARARQAAAALANNTSSNSSNSGSIEDVGQKHVENFEFSSSDGSDAPFDTYDNPEQLQQLTDSSSAGSLQATAANSATVPAEDVVFSWSEATGASLPHLGSESLSQQEIVDKISAIAAAQAQPGGMTEADYYSIFGAPDSESTSLAARPPPPELDQWLETGFTQGDLEGDVLQQLALDSGSSTVDSAAVGSSSSSADGSSDVEEPLLGYSSDAEIGDFDDGFGDAPADDTADETADSNGNDDEYEQLLARRRAAAATSTTAAGGTNGSRTAAGVSSAASAATAATAIDDEDSSSDADYDSDDWEDADISDDVVGGVAQERQFHTVVAGSSGSSSSSSSSSSSKHADALSQLLSGEDMEIPDDAVFITVPVKKQPVTAVAVQDEDHGVMLERPSDDPFFLNRMPLAMRQRYIAAYAEQAYDAAVEAHGKPDAHMLNAMLRVHAEALRIETAEAFLREEFALHGVQPDAKTARQMVRMYSRARQPEAAAAMEVTMREQWGLRADHECLGMVLNEWSKRDDHERMAHTLDICLREDTPPPEKWLYFTRRNAIKARFEHPGLPADPNALLREVAAKARKAKRVRQDVHMVKSRMSKTGISGASRRLY